MQKSSYQVLGGFVPSSPCILGDELNKVMINWDEQWRDWLPNTNHERQIKNLRYQNYHVSIKLFSSIYFGIRDKKLHQGGTILLLNNKNNEI